MGLDPLHTQPGTKYGQQLESRSQDIVSNQDKRVTQKQGLRFQNNLRLASFSSYIGLAVHQSIDCIDYSRAAVPHHIQIKVPKQSRAANK